MDKKITERLKSLENADKVFYKNVAGSVGIKGAAILVSFLTTQSYLRYFEDTTVLGVWFTLLTILQWILTFDLGIGNGLRNEIVPLLEKKDFKGVKEFISSGYLSLSGVSIVICMAGGGLFWIIDWNKALNVSEEVIPADILALTICVAFVGIILQFIFKIIISLFYALRMNVLASGTMLISNILLWLYLSVADFGHVYQNLIGVAAAYGGTILLPLLLASIYAFAGPLRGCGPNAKYFQWSKAKKVLSLGGTFFAVQMELLLLTATDSWLISFFFKAADVVSYQIYYKLFSLPTTMFSLISQPLWSSITVAAAKGEYGWIRKKNRQVNLIGVFMSLICILEVILIEPILDLWVGKSNCEIRMGIALAFAVLSMEQIFMYASTSIANGISKLNCQVICNFLALLVKFSFTFLAAEKSGKWESIIWIEAAGTLFITVLQPVFNRINLKKLERMGER